MGISGLLPLLKSVQKHTHLSELGGKTIGVDAYVWLHRGAYACATELVTGKCTTRYVDYAMHRVRLLQYYKITPYMVFDGGHLPAKDATNAERKRKREKNMVLAKTLAQQGKHLEAREYYAKCVDITPQMAFQLIKALRAENVSYVVAPYEADAQLVYLERTGVVDGILTEDSDMLIFGANLVLLKLDVPTATCTAISSDTLASNAPSDLALYGWGVAELRACAMLSGCDYLEGVRGVGLKTAGKVMRRWGTIEKALRSLRMDGKRVDRDWENRMRLAEAAFLHQRVWDAQTEKIVYLSDPNLATWNEERERFVGRYIEPELAARLVRGDVDPFTFEPMIDIMPSFQPSERTCPRPLAPKDPNRGVSLRPVDDKKEAKGPLFQYFAKQPKPATPTSIVMPLQQTLSASAPARSMRVGGASGKRTLAEQYDIEAEKSIKRSRISENDAMCCSKFFSTPPSVLPAFDDDKENLEEFDHLDVASLDEVDVEIAVVEEEDRPLSPSPVVSSPEHQRSATPDFSSPLQHRRGPPVPLQTRDGSTQKELRNSLEEDKVDDISDDGRITSPSSASKTPRASTQKAGLKVTMITQRDLRRHRSGVPSTGELLDVDLRDVFSESPTSKITEGLRTAASVKRVKFYTNTSSSCSTVVTKAKDRVLRRQETMRLPFRRSKASTSQRTNIVNRQSHEWTPKTQSISCTVERASDDSVPAATSSQRAVVDDPGT